MILIIFTSSYPYDFAAEQTFLERELPYLVMEFDKVILVPKISRGTRFIAPPEVEVEESFAGIYESNTKLVRLLMNALGSNHFYNELFMHLLLLLQPVKLMRLVLFSSRAEITKKWLLGWLNLRNINPDQVVFYSYWFDEIAMGIGLVKRTHPQIKLISRAHGYDIYEEVYFPYYWPCRTKTLSALDKLFPASDAGSKYFRDHYPEYSSLIETSHLGVTEPGFISNPSQDEVFRIVSCSNIYPVKRIDLLLEGIALAASIRPSKRFEWRHSGGGKGLVTLQQLQAKIFPRNAVGHLPGNVPNREILLDYKEQPVDVFVNVSSSEGGAPVSIMEAISCGIPVIATNVGGNPEIVSERNGILLSSDPTKQELAEAILKFCDNPEMARNMRAESRKVWQESFRADLNYRSFAKKLKRLRLTLYGGR